MTSTYHAKKPPKGDFCVTDEIAEQFQGLERWREQELKERFRSVAHRDLYQLNLLTTAIFCSSNVVDYDTLRE